MGNRNSPQIVAPECDLQLPAYSIALKYDMHSGRKVDRLKHIDSVEPGRPPSGQVEGPVVGQFPLQKYAYDSLGGHHSVDRSGMVDAFDSDLIEL